MAVELSQSKKENAAYLAKVEQGKAIEAISSRKVSMDAFAGHYCEPSVSTPWPSQPSNSTLYLIQPSVTF